LDQCLSFKITPHLTLPIKALNNWQAQRKCL